MHCSTIYTIGWCNQPIASLESEWLFHITCSGHVIPFVFFRNKCATNGDNCPLGQLKNVKWNDEKDEKYTQIDSIDSHYTFFLISAKRMFIYFLTTQTKEKQTSTYWHIQHTTNASFCTILEDFGFIYKDHKCFTLHFVR